MATIGEHRPAAETGPHLAGAVNGEHAPYLDAAVAAGDGHGMPSVDYDGRSGSRPRIGLASLRGGRPAVGDGREIIRAATLMPRTWSPYLRRVPKALFGSDGPTVTDENRLVLGAMDAAATAWRRLRAREHRIQVLAIASAFFYLIGMSVYLITHGGWPTPDYLIPPLLLVALALGRGGAFLVDWTPFLLLVLSWQATAGIANKLGRPVHVTEPLAIDRWLHFGRLPTVELQQWFYNPAQAAWYDWAATLQHAAHFVLPVAVGLVLWLRGRQLYWRYLASVLLLFYLGFAGYALYPAAPPWMAGLQEQAPFVHRIAVETVLRLPRSAPIGLAYTHFNPNPVAAIPSLHAALPLLLALVLIHLWGKRALPALLYPLTMGYNLVYLGEHYVIDVYIGYAVALVAYLAVWQAPRWIGVPALPDPRQFVPAMPQSVARVPWRGLAQLFTPSIAVVSVALIGMTLRPGRPADAPGPVVPGLAVQAGQPVAMPRVTCDQGAAANLTIDDYLVEVAGRFAAFLIDLTDHTCYALSAAPSFAPPAADRISRIAERAPIHLASLTRSGSSGEFVALRIGPASPQLQAEGMPEGRRYLLMVELADVPDPLNAAYVIDVIQELIITPERYPTSTDYPVEPFDEELPPSPAPPTIAPETPTAEPPASEPAAGRQNSIPPPVSSGDGYDLAVREE